MKCAVLTVFIVLMVSGCKKVPQETYDYCAEIKCGQVTGYNSKCLSVDESAYSFFSNLIKICQEECIVRKDTETFQGYRSLMLNFAENTFNKREQFLFIGMHKNLEKYSTSYFSNLSQQLPNDTDLIEGKWYIPRYSRVYSILPNNLKFNQPAFIYFQYDLYTINDYAVWPDEENILFPKETFAVLKIDPVTKKIIEVLNNVEVIPTEENLPYGRGLIKARIDETGHYVPALPISAKNGINGGEIRLTTSGYRNLDILYKNTTKGGFYLVPVLQNPYTFIQIDYSGNSDANGKATIRFEGNKPGVYPIDGTKNVAKFFYKDSGMKNVVTLDGEIIIERYDPIGKTIKGVLHTTQLGGQTENANKLRINAEFEVFHVNPW